MNSFSQYINAEVTTTTDSDAGTGGYKSGAINAANLLDCSEKLYNHGGNPSMLMVSPSKAQTIAGFATATGRERDFGTGTTLVNVVDVMVTPYNQLKLVLNRHMLTDRVFD